MPVPGGQGPALVPVWTRGNETRAPSLESPWSSPKDKGSCAGTCRFCLRQLNLLARKNLRQPSADQPSTLLIKNNKSVT